MPISTRRRFLQTAATAGAALSLPVNVLRAAGPSQQVNLGIVGCGGRGLGMLNLFKQIPGVNIAGVCDPDQQRVDRARKAAPSAKQWTDMRHLFDAPEIDAVVVATCNHWHCLAAVWAMQAGKHVYVEKPLGHTEWEGQQVVAAAEKFKRVCQVGTQQRSDPLQAEIKQFLHEEKTLGEIQSVRVNRLGERKPIGRRSAPMTPPKSLDYNLWLGPAQDLPINRKNLHYDWHWVWNTGSGEMGNWGVHIIDDVRNNLFQDKVSAPESITAAGGRVAWDDAGETPNVHFALLEAAGIPVVVTLSNLADSKKIAKAPGPGTGYVAYCSGGRFEGRRGGAAAYDESGKLIRKFKGDTGLSRHARNFIEAVRQEDSSILTAPAKIGHDSTTWCNLINLATRVPAAPVPGSEASHMPHFGSDSSEKVYESLLEVARAAGEQDVASKVSLGPTMRFNANQGKFVGKHANTANKLLRREYRPAFEFPEIKQTQVARTS